MICKAVEGFRFHRILVQELYVSPILWISHLGHLFLPCFISNVLFQIAHYCSAEGRGWPSVTRQWWMMTWRTYMFLKYHTFTRNHKAFFPSVILILSGLGGPSWQCWEPRLPALRVRLMINPLLSYRAITTFLLVNMNWIADLLCWNKLAFFLHSYIGYYLSKEVKRTQKDLGVYCGYIAQFIEVVKYKFRLLLMLIIFSFTSSPQHWSMEIKGQPKALVVTECKLCKAVALSEGNVFIDSACPKFEWCPNTSAQEPCFGECPLNWCSHQLGLEFKGGPISLWEGIMQ